MRRLQLPCASLLFLLMMLSSMALARQAKSPASAVPVAVRGRLVCAVEPATPSHDRRCIESPHLFKLAAADGRSFSFMPTDSLTAIFADPRIRQRELQITAQQISKDELELIKVQSFREGKLYDLYYFCEVCNITAYAPGLCSCCRQELEFRETPAGVPDL
jgi:hypothetical protein